MSYKSKIIEWDVPLSEVQSGIPIGYEVEFSQKSSYNPILYRLTTFEEVKDSPQGVFFYSLDNGITWINFPIGEGGQAFYTAYKIRLIVNGAETGNIFAEKNGTVYRIRGDGKSVIENYQIGSFSGTGFEIGTDNSLYVAGTEQTLYKIDTSEELKPGHNSINIHSDPLGIIVDGTRKTFWQVDGETVYLKSMDGNEIFSVNLPLPREESPRIHSWGVCQRLI